MTNSECLFCKIVQNEIPAKRVAESDRALAFNDINPQAPTHVLIIPKQHTSQVSDLANMEVIADLYQLAAKIARDQGLKDYRLVTNNGAGAGQSVFHIHLHLLGGRPFSWPPG